MWLSGDVMQLLRYCGWLSRWCYSMQLLRCYGWLSGCYYVVANAGYTLQDNRANFGAISRLPTILGNVPIILVVLKTIFSDFPVVWGVLRVTESARKNVRGSPIANRSEILMCGEGGGTPRTPHTIGAKRLNLGFFCPHVCGLSHILKIL